MRKINEFEVVKVECLLGDGRFALLKKCDWWRKAVLLLAKLSVIQTTAGRKNLLSDE